MALKECSDCGNKISTEAEKCPYCGKPNREMISKKSRDPKISILLCIIFGFLWFYAGLKPLLGNIYRLSDKNTFVCGNSFCLRAAYPTPYTAGDLYYCPDHIRRTVRIGLIESIFCSTPGLPSLALGIVFGLGGIISLFVPRLRKKLLDSLSSK